MQLTADSDGITNRSPDLSIARARLQGLVSQATAELERYSHFAAGWDGYSGEPISPVAIKTAEYLIEAVAAMTGGQLLTDIVPGPAPDGSLDLELRTEKRRLIVTIYPGNGPNEIEIRTFRTDGVASEEKNDLGPDALVGDTRWLLA
jgi:hypothetical protein